MRLSLSLTFLFISSCLMAQSGPDAKAAELYRLGKNSGALTRIDAVLRTDRTPDNLTLKGDILVRMEKVQEAYDLYTTALQLNPDYVLAYNSRGILLTSVQQNEEAIKDFNRGLAILTVDSMRHVLLLNRAVAHLQQRDFEKAYRDLFSIYKEDSTNIAVINNLAAVCDEVGRGDETIGYLLRVVQLDSTFVGGYANLGFKYQVMGDYLRSNQYYDKVIALSPSEALAYSNKAYNYLKLGDMKSAHRDIEKGIRLYPANSYAYRNRALIYLAEKNMPKACADITKALELGFTKMYSDEVEQLQQEHCRDKK